jgi:phosphatidate phosphatase PAH1
MGNTEKVRLPEGPLMMSPDGYVISFMREVYYKSTDKFKAQILASIL